jgi:plasmid stabilization system protein ParE
MVKKYKVRITPKARQDLSQIVQYLRRSESNTVATNVKRGIMEAIGRLETYPESHEAFKEISTEQVVFHRMLKREYKIVYTVDKEELVVLVVKIYHSHQRQEGIIDELKS